MCVEVQLVWISEDYVNPKVNIFLLGQEHEKRNLHGFSSTSVHIFSSNNDRFSEPNSRIGLRIVDTSSFQWICG